MGLVGRFARLERAERRLALRAALLMGVISLGLSTVPLRMVRRLLALRAVPKPGDPGTLALDDIARAVTRASAVVPGSTCLVRALALHTLLERRGCSAELRMGFARTASGSLGGHAWVEAGGNVFGGDSFGHASIPLPRVNRP